MEKEEIKKIRIKHLKRLNRRGKRYRELSFTEQRKVDNAILLEIEGKEEEKRILEMLTKDVSHIPKKLDFDSPNFPKTLETAIEGEKKLEGQFEQTSEQWGFCQKCHCQPCICRREEND